MKTSRLMILSIVLMVLVTASVVEAKPLKIYILTGQSNMQGKASPETLPSMAADPKTKALYDKIVDADGEPRVYDNVCIAALSSSRGVEGTKNGPLTTGYGGGLGEGETAFGTELAFGITMYEQVKEPILIIKASWGGKSLHTDFRPPSAGPFYPDPSKVKDRMGNKGLIPAEQILAEKEEKQHRYYQRMMQHIKTVLADPGKYHPAYDPKDGYELAGFVWFQGWNDMIGGGDELYMATEDRPQYAAYTDLMALFIRDIRKELEAPNMPFVIGVLGVGGVTDGPFQKAQAATADMPEFKGNVVAVLTGDYWDHKLAELDTRNFVSRGDGRSQRRADPEGKYKALQAKVIPLVEERNALIGRTQEIRQKRDELQEKILNTIFTPEERTYYEQGRSNASFHYLGSAKIYSQIGEAFADALFELKK